MEIKKRNTHIKYGEFIGFRCQSEVKKAVKVLKKRMNVCAVMRLNTYNYIDSVLTTEEKEQVGWKSKN